MKMKNLKEKMFLLTSFHMNNEQLFWYIRIEKMLDAYDMISKTLGIQIRKPK